MAKIEYKGKTLETKVPITHLTDEQVKQLREEFYRKPELEKVIKQMKTIHNGGTLMNKIVDYYIKHLIAQVTIETDKWSMADVFECKELLEFFYSKTLQNPKVFNSKSLLANICTAIRIGGKGAVRKASNYPIKSVREILELYNVNGNYYDYSCGWSARLLGALSMEINYFGTDPNYLLTEQLEKIAELYKEVNGINTITDIRTQGSEHLVEEWVGKMGVAFSSPPYFDLEDYKVGDQSINYGNYEAWKEKYLRPTFENIKKYLVKDGFFILNLKDTKRYAMLTDAIKIAEELGFQIHAIHELKNISRKYGVQNGKGMMGTVNNNEQIVVFKLTN